MMYLCKNHIQKSETRLENRKRTGKTLFIPCYESFTRLVPPPAVVLGSLKSKVVLVSKVRKTKEKLAVSREAGKQKVVVEGST